jgi:hypothetical protein
MDSPVCNDEYAITVAYDDIGNNDNNSSKVDNNYSLINDISDQI